MAKIHHLRVKEIWKEPSAREFETPEDRKTEVDNGGWIQKDMHQEIYFKWKNFGRKQVQRV
jgi:hypothetical protein